MAKREIKDLERKAEAKAFGHPGCLAGNIVYVRDEHTGLIGKFYIDADNHTWNRGIHNMTLTLNFENLMDEKELEAELSSESNNKDKDTSKNSTTKKNNNKKNNNKNNNKNTSSVTDKWYHTNIPGHGPNVNPK